MKIRASASIYWGSPLESIGGVDNCSPWEVEIQDTSVVLEVETIVVHGRWRFKILDSTIIRWGSPLESIGGVVLMLNVNKYIHLLLYSCR